MKTKNLLDTVYKEMKENSSNVSKEAVASNYFMVLLEEIFSSAKAGNAEAVTIVLVVTNIWGKENIQLGVALEEIKKSFSIEKIKEDKAAYTEEFLEIVSQMLRFLHA